MAGDWVHVTNSDLVESSQVDDGSTFALWLFAGLMNCPPDDEHWKACHSVIWRVTHLSMVKRLESIINDGSIFRTQRIDF